MFSCFVYQTKLRAKRMPKRSTTNQFFVLTRIFPLPWNDGGVYESSFRPQPVISENEQITWFDV
jgi:hypothetical protein